MIADAQPFQSRVRRDAPAPITIEGLLPHHNLEAERSLLGAMLADPDQVVDLAREKGMREEDFFHPAHQIIFRGISEMRESSQAIDPSTLLAWLTDRKLADAAGGPALISDLAAGVISRAEFDEVGRVVLLHRRGRAVFKVLLRGGVCIVPRWFEAGSQ